jgi:hypothetical protein
MKRSRNGSGRRLKLEQSNAALYLHEILVVMSSNSSSQYIEEAISVSKGSTSSGVFGLSYDNAIT